MASHDNVAHHFANDTGKCMNGFNMFYEYNADGSRTIYSHGRHFPICTIGKDAHGDKVVLFTSRNYSISTSQHKAIVIRSLDHTQSAQALYVSNARADHIVAHKENMQALKSEIEETAALWVKARSRKPEHADRIEQLVNTANKYRKRFKLGRYFKELSAPEDIAQYAKDMEEENRKALEAAARKGAKRLMEQERQNQEKIEQWVSGENVRAPHTALPYVRIKGDTVQTSYGANVPLDSAIALFKLANKCKIEKRDFKPAKPHRIGDFNLRMIDNQGTLYVACHTIPYAYQEAAANRAGIVL